MKAALFDLDGVVFDTEPQYSIFWGAQCREFHPEHPGLEHEIKGQTLVQIYDAWFSGPLADKQALITERLNEYEQQMSYDYLAGFEQYIKGLRAQGVKTAVVTSSNQPKMEAVYKSHPEFKDCVVFEDSFNGLKSGRAAGMYVVGLATTNAAEAIKPYCDEVINDYINFIR